MQYTAIFQRHEIKFLLSTALFGQILPLLDPYMAADPHGAVTVRNIYLDSDHFRLIRRSMEKPLYKEKLRLRSYAPPLPGSDIFVELKKKYNSIVYKRRVAMAEASAIRWLSGADAPAEDCQITREIDYFRRFYAPLRPQVFLSYDRRAYYCPNGGDLRITFDTNILCRDTDLTLSAEIGGVPLLADDKVLMEIKTLGGVPLWLTKILSDHRLYRTSFSKYGTAYETLIFPKLKGELFHA